MAAVGTKEINFEEEIEACLLGASGYTRSKKENFDLAVGIDTVELFAFLSATQADAWEQVVKRYGGDEAKARAGWRPRVRKSTCPAAISITPLALGYACSRCGTWCPNARVCTLRYRRNVRCSNTTPMPLHRWWMRWRREQLEIVNTNPLSAMVLLPFCVYRATVPATVK
mgnify:CR=1 FL=1